MILRITHAIVFVALFASLMPGVLSADRRSDLQQQIANTFEQIRVLQAQLDAQTNADVAEPTTSSVSANCPDILRALSVGSRGNDVTELQQFLAQDPSVYPEGLVTGFYGTLTQRAVERWQEKNGIVSSGAPETTGYGLVGPQTRRSLKSCGGVSPSQFSGFLNISPTSGSAPKLVTADVTVNASRSCDRAVYRLDFGDGTAPTEILVPHNHCQPLSKTITHTYQKPGTYSVAFGVGSNNTHTTVTIRPGSESSATNTNSAVMTAPNSESIRAQMQSLSAHVQSLQAELDTLGPESSSDSPTPSSPTSSVPSVSVTNGGLSLSSQLEEGDRGDDVSRLQQFLAQDPSVYPEGLVTGFYGTLTTAAVQRFQARCDVASSGTPATTGYGRVGPKTMQTLAQGCGAGSVDADEGEVGGLLRVTPIKGAAPLSVTAVATVNTALSCSRAVYELDFGDGGTPFQLVVPEGACKEISQNVPHTYSSMGTYIVTLSIGPHQSTVRVDVGTGESGETGDDFFTRKPDFDPSVSVENGITAEPLSDEVPLTVTFNATINGVASCKGGSYAVDFGDGETAELPYPADNCNPQKFKVTHRYDTSGDYVVRLYPSAPEEIGSVSHVAQIALSLTRQEDGITAEPLSDEVPLTVTFNTTINAAESCNGGSYAVDFGDGEIAELPYPSDSCEPEKRKITHRYDTSGDYVVRLYPSAPEEIGSVSHVAQIALSLTRQVVDHGDFAIAAGVDGNPRKIKVEFGINGPSCTSYRLKWGEGLPVEEHDAGAGISCASESVVKDFEYTYPSAGSYTVRLQRARGSLSSLSNNAKEETATIVISE